MSLRGSQFNRLVRREGGVNRNGPHNDPTTGTFWVTLIVVILVIVALQQNWIP